MYIILFLKNFPNNSYFLKDSWIPQNETPLLWKQKQFEFSSYLGHFWSFLLEYFNKQKPLISNEWHNIYNSMIILAQHVNLTFFVKIWCTLTILLKRLPTLRATCLCWLLHNYIDSATSTTTHTMYVHSTRDKAIFFLQNFLGQGRCFLKQPR